MKDYYFLKRGNSLHLSKNISIIKKFSIKKDFLEFIFSPDSHYKWNRVSVQFRRKNNFNKEEKNLA